MLRREPKRRYVHMLLESFLGTAMGGKDMRVLVTGGAGYIGSHTAKALAKALGTSHWCSIISAPGTGGR